MTDSNKTGALRLQLIIAIATNPLAYEAIEETYNENPGYYYECYYHSDFFEHPVFRLYPTYKYMYIKKMAGIYADSVKRDDNTLVIKLLRKGYNAVYQHIRKSDSVEMKKAINVALRGEKIERVDEETLGNTYIVIFYIIQVLRKRAGNIESFAYWTSRYVNYLDDMTKAEDQHVEVGKHFQEIRDYYNHFRIKESSYNIGNILDNLVDRDIEEGLASEGLSISDVTQEFYVQFRSDTFKGGGVSSVIGLLSSMYNYMGFSELLLNQKITKLEFDHFMSKYIELIKVNNVPEEFQETLLISLIMAFALSKEYTFTRNEALDASEKTAYITQKVEKDKDREEIKKLKKQSKRWIVEQKQLKKELKESKQSGDKLYKELKRTQDELSKNKENEKELIALRNHMFELQQNKPVFLSEDSHEFELETSIEKLSLFDIVIIGGHSNWVSNMKEVLPEIAYIGGDSVNVDLSLLDREGAIVFFNTDNNTHAQYERVTTIMNQNKNRFHYMSGLTNLDRTIGFMIRTLDI